MKKLRVRPGPKALDGTMGKESPILAFRVTRPVMARLKRRARKGKKPYGELARDVLTGRAAPVEP